MSRTVKSTNAHRVRLIEQDFYTWLRCHPVPRVTPTPQSASLCLPDPLDSLRDTNVVGLELVQAHANHHGCDVQAPPKDLARARVPPVGNVVDEYRLETHVGVEEHRAAQDGVRGGVQRAGGKGGDRERHESCGEKTFEGPVVGTVGGIRCRDRGRIVDC